MSFTPLLIHLLDIQKPTFTITSGDPTAAYSDSETNVPGRVDPITDLYLYPIEGQISVETAKLYLDSTRTLLPGYLVINKSDSSKRYIVKSVNKVPGGSGYHHIEALLAEEKF